MAKANKLRVLRGNTKVRYICYNVTRADYQRLTSVTVCNSILDLLQSWCHSPPSCYKCYKSVTAESPLFIGFVTNVTNVTGFLKNVKFAKFSICRVKRKSLTMMSTSPIKEIKEKFTCLDYLGKPLKKTAHGYLYRAPWRTDTHPSLSVTENGKGWHDLATGDHGNLIGLVMRCLNTNDLSRVCNEFVDPSSFSKPIVIDIEKKEEVASGFVKFEVIPLRSRGLFAYLYSRKISIEIAKQFLEEAHYSFKVGDSYLYALAYSNDKGGYELRSSRYKGGTSPKGITTHSKQGNLPWVVFEGFFDMLSFATLCGEVRHNYIVLNSVVNIPAAIEQLRGIKQPIYLALDNDNAGSQATRRMIEQLPGVKDIRSRFAPSKDINEYLQHNK